MEVIYYLAASLDGYIAAEDGSVDWLNAFNVPGEDYGYADFFDSLDAILMGSRTYLQILGFGDWPYAGKPCWVFTRQALDIPAGEIFLTSRAPKRVLMELEALGLERAWLVGGAQLAASFRQLGLIDEYYLTYMPVILGGGIGLLGPGEASEALNLVSSQVYPNGIVQVRYRTHPAD